MARRHTRSRVASKADGGASWISYSDMMAALLLVFVLVLCYSVYQYFLMLETKTAELDEQSALLTQQQATLDEQREELTAQQAALTDKQNELTAALTQLDEKESLLNDQSLTLEEQEKIILAAQTALSQKEEELNAANQELTNKQQELADATILLGQQQDTLNAQQQKLDDLVGVRTEIVRDLTAALSQADLKATVDGNTGDIMLESAVFSTWPRAISRTAAAPCWMSSSPFIWVCCFSPNMLTILGKSSLRAIPTPRAPIWSIWNCRRSAL